MSDLAISARGLGKRYRVGQVETAGARLRRRVARREAPDSMWAFRDLTFDIEQGDSVAIVGRNGAGKSTLLKVLSRITEPTAGYADMSGRVGALLEVGTGFHAQLTGRENVFLNGALLGMSRAEVTRKFDEIVEFSGVSRHIDTPVKWYSSGMYVRLAFAVAAHLEPEILIVDEVLAVGDAEFQKRCLGRMSEAAYEGRTVLFVSHNLQAVRTLCKRAILLEGGRMADDGETDGVVRRYLALVEPLESGIRRWDDPASRPGNETCRLAEVRVSDANGETRATFFSSQEIFVSFEFDLGQVEPALVVAFDLVSSDGATVFRSYSSDAGEDIQPGERAGRAAVRCTIPSGLLNAGRYLLNVRVFARGIDGVVNAPSSLHFDVTADHGESYFLTPLHGRPGLIAPVLPWEVVEPESEAESMPPEGTASAAR
jgi:lipopolysaccharide transport system ATP-binding protein